MDIKRPKHFITHKNVSSLFLNNPFLAGKDDNFWSADSLIPVEKHKVILWEQSHPWANGQKFPEQPFYNEDKVQDLIEIASKSLPSEPLKWSGKGLNVQVGGTNACLSMVFNGEAQRQFKNILDDVQINANNMGIKACDNYDGYRALLVKIARRPISKKHIPEAKQSKDLIATKFSKLAIYPFKIDSFTLAAGMYDQKGNHVVNKDIATIRLG